PLARQLDLHSFPTRRSSDLEYNGVKFFDADGRKLSDESEGQIEQLRAAAPSIDQGDVDRVEIATDSYLEHIVDRFGSDLGGMRVVVDCANGAYAHLAPQAFERLGAKVQAIGNEPDGTNINVGCGATATALLSRTVPDGGFDLGI